MFTLPHRLKEKNPQFAREVKGRLKPRNVLTTVLLSALAQLLLLASYYSQLPGVESTSAKFPDVYNRFCTITRESFSYRACTQDALGNWVVDWRMWWQEIVGVISWVLPLLLLTAAVYLLINDLGREERRGTLNFVRMSPERSQNILLGKLVGVPVLPYLGVVLIVPLHLFAAIQGGIPLGYLAVYYGLILLLCAFWSLLAILFAWLGGNQGWLGVIALWLSYAMFAQVARHQPYQLKEAEGNLVLNLPNWWGLSTGKIEILLVFGLITLGPATLLLWKAANRRFRRPNATLLTRTQSYLATAFLQIWLLGFVVVSTNSARYPETMNDSLTLVLVANLGWFLCLMAILLPHRQTLIDWARYRRQQVGCQRTGRQIPLLSDLVFGENSPASGAIAMNLAIAVGINALWVSNWPVLSDRPDHRFEALFALVMAATSLLLCAMVAQLLLMQRSPKRAVWTATTIGGLLLIPPICLGVFITTYGITPLTLLWAFTVASPVLVWQSSGSLALLGWLSQITACALVTSTLTRKLIKAGESESKALLGSVRSDV